MLPVTSVPSLLSLVIIAAITDAIVCNTVRNADEIDWNKKLLDLFVESLVIMLLSYLFALTCACNV